MSAGSLAPVLQQFIARYIRSVEQVEILCLLSSDPARTWTVDEVLRTIQSSAKSVADCLETFREDGLLDSSPAGGYCLPPKTPELAQAVNQLAAAYRERRVTVVETIYRKPTDTIQDFADAFRWRKEK